MNGNAYNSAELTLFTEVLDCVCLRLGVVDTEYRANIGKRIMFKAESGERRFVALADFAAQGTLFPPSRPGIRKREEIRIPYPFSMIDPAADRGRLKT